VFNMTKLVRPDLAVLGMVAVDEKAQKGRREKTQASNTRASSAARSDPVDDDFAALRRFLWPSAIDHPEALDK
jgi:hypothetical protein